MGVCQRRCYLADDYTFRSLNKGSPLTPPNLHSLPRSFSPADHKLVPVLRSPKHSLCRSQGRTNHRCYLVARVQLLMHRQSNRYSLRQMQKVSSILCGEKKDTVAALFVATQFLKHQNIGIQFRCGTLNCSRKRA
ncbi:hypothetical protein CEXT_671661 [Caerostris extrusa]|uniref:Uncharacterized protein n=1 Tax=Caerostris extrusa TaxID=172846 RepID=A0AAV4XB73_CAEEX|nr:hypothetical protein CEXT_671661 [Caerostris extrusa]